MQARPESRPMPHHRGANARRPLPAGRRPFTLARAAAAPVALLVVLAGCEPSAAPRSTAYYSPTSGQAGGRIRSANGRQDERQPDQPVSSTEPDIPLPPGWAQELAHLRERQAAVKNSSPDPLAGFTDESPDDLGLPRGDDDVLAAEDLFSGYGSPRERRTSDRRGGRVGLSTRPRPARPVRSQPPAGNYTVMAIVFLAPLVALAFVLWLWHVASAMRSAEVDRMGAGSVRRAS